MVCPLVFPFPSCIPRFSSATQNQKQGIHRSHVKKTLKPLFESSALAGPWGKLYPAPAAAGFNIGPCDQYKRHVHNFFEWIFKAFKASSWEMYGWPGTQVVLEDHLTEECFSRIVRATVLYYSLPTHRPLRHLTRTGDRSNNLNSLSCLPRRVQRFSRPSAPSATQSKRFVLVCMRGKLGWWWVGVQVL